MKLRLYDAHNHLQDARFAGRTPDLVRACREHGVVRMVVNGSGEEDWRAVLELARTYPEVLPSVGYHPWYVAERTPHWQQTLARLLEAAPCAVGEIGLDRWKPGLPYDGQEEVFVAQLRMAAERNRPVSIHCLKAWGRLYELLRQEPRPAAGVLLHSYGGPAEMVAAFARLGAYFSLPGYFAHERKARQQAAFRVVPADRLLIETDAPDQNLPESRRVHALVDAATGAAINHPANLLAVYTFASELRGESMENLSRQVEANFLRLFGAAGE